MCNFCDAAKRLLVRNNLSYNEIDISTKDGLRDEMTKRANGRRTIPQIFFDEHHVGGYQELRELEKTGKLLPQESRAKSQGVQGLMFQMSGIGPMMGQSNVFFRYFPEKLPAVIQRYQNECRRLFEVLDRQLENRNYLCGEYSIADIANWCWVRIHQWGGSDISSLDNLLGWINRMEQKPACKKGVCVPHEIDFSELERDLTNNDSAVRGLVTQ